jgi:hypothetical protein
MNRSFFAAVGAVILLTSCATGVLQIGDNLYMNSRQGSFALVPTGRLKAELLEEARSFCARNGLSVEVVGSTEQIGSLGRSLPEASLQFRCNAVK